MWNAENLRLGLRVELCTGRTRVLQGRPVCTAAVRLVNLWGWIHWHTGSKTSEFKQAVEVGPVGILGMGEMGMGQVRGEEVQEGEGTEQTSG